MKVVSRGNGWMQPLVQRVTNCFSVKVIIPMEKDGCMDSVTRSTLLLSEKAWPDSVGRQGSFEK